MKLRGALLGAGNISLRSHAPQWVSNPSMKAEVDIVAVADLSPSNLARVRELVPEARVYADAVALLEREDLDFCDICTPPFTHTTLVSRAAARGLHVICEKPLAPTTAEAERIVAAVERAGTVFQPCHQYHFSPQWLALRERLPRLGNVYLAEYEVDRTSANPGNANWSPAWRTDPALSGGGILFDHGAHIFYQLRAVLGEPMTVQATVRTLHHMDYGVEDTAFVTLDHGTCLAQVRLSWAARRRGIRFRFVGEHGEISGDDEKLWLNAESREEVRFDSGLSQDSSHAEWYAPLFAEFVGRVRSGRRDSDGLLEAAYVTRLIARAYQSSGEGRALALTPAAAPVEAPRPWDEAAFTAVPVISLLSGGDRQGSDSVAAAPGASPSRRRRIFALRGAAVAAIAASVAWAFHDVQPAAVWSSMSTADPGWLGLAAGVNLLVLLFQSARWLALIRPMAPRASLGQAFKSTAVGYAISSVVPARVGELARVEWLGRYTGLPRIAVLGSALLDQLVNAAGLLVGVALLPLFVRVPLWMRQDGWFALVLFMIGVALVVALRRSARGPDDAWPDLLNRLPLRTVSGALLRVRSGLLACGEPRALLYSLGASLAAWGFEINVAALSMRAAGLHLPVVVSIVVLVAVNLALAVPFAPPGNLGTLELGATLALVEFGVPKERALAFALCYHFLQVIPVGIIGFWAMSRGATPRSAPEAA
ncbi:MAG TPA: lysylphosphatidylglycerol synthase domain-containing protein [Vicinamibacteria bacterium]|nr:lysylphosphatidylglycerol synthase domain-containing protein [Vicinamibacteria bacterium]